MQMLTAINFITPAAQGKGRKRLNEAARNPEKTKPISAFGVRNQSIRFDRRGMPVADLQESESAHRQTGLAPRVSGQAR